MHVVAGGIKLNSGEGEEQKVDIQQIIGKIHILPHLNNLYFFGYFYSANFTFRSP